MKLCTESITVYNKRVDSLTGGYNYYPTVINGVSWFARIETTVDDGLKAANAFVIRIPIDADFSGKEYADPIAYKAASDIEKLFTLAQGDVIVRAAVVTAIVPMKPADLKALYNDFCTILGVTDNRRAPNGKHFKVVGA